MKFSKEEKKFWQAHYHFDKPSQIHENWQQIWSADGNEDDDFFYFFTKRVTTIQDVYLKDTLITDKAVAYMVQFKELKSLFLRRHQTITNACIPFINQMKQLETLNITKTNITLADLCELLNNKSLKEVFLDSTTSDTEENIFEKGFMLKERMPNCSIFLNHSFSTDVFGNPIKPIF